MSLFFLVALQFVLFGAVAGMAIRSFRSEYTRRTLFVNRRCSRCASDYPHFANYCGRCGQPLRDTNGLSRRRQSW